MHKYFAGYVHRYAGLEKSMTSYVKFKESPNFQYSLNYEMKKKNKQVFNRLNKVNFKELFFHKASNYNANY